MKIGEVMPLDRDIVLNDNKKTTTVTVANVGRSSGSKLDRISISFEVNRCLNFGQRGCLWISVRHSIWYVGTF